ncbi:hypothetical protein BdWA1_001107 [Babesia duncani]|uniref:Uncharacterized protein n=1 Tax=Babesia duncani TaxID=323732 RepID=A0AAD9UQQ2_9APIC|nr:hypothetical protein BdWA1_001107 [Babesia duncani]
MQRSDKVQQPTEKKVVEQMLPEDTAWIYKGYEEMHKAANEKESQQKSNHLKIRYLSRKSFNGANPVVEKYMHQILTNRW